MATEFFFLRICFTVNLPLGFQSGFPPEKVAVGQKFAWLEDQPKDFQIQPIRCFFIIIKNTVWLFS